MPLTLTLTLQDSGPFSHRTMLGFSKLVNEEKKKNPLASGRMSPNRVLQTIFDCVVQYSVGQVVLCGIEQ